MGVRSTNLKASAIYLCMRSRMRCGVEQERLGRLTRRNVVDARLVQVSGARRIRTWLAPVRHNGLGGEVHGADVANLAVGRSKQCNL